MRDEELNARGFHARWSALLDPITVRTSFPGWGCAVSASSAIRHVAGRAIAEDFVDARAPDISPGRLNGLMPCADLVALTGEQFPIPLENFPPGADALSAARIREFPAGRARSVRDLYAPERSFPLTAIPADGAEIFPGKLHRGWCKYRGAKNSDPGRLAPRPKHSGNSSGAIIFRDVSSIFSGNSRKRHLSVTQGRVDVCTRRKRLEDGLDRGLCLRVPRHVHLAENQLVHIVTEGNERGS